MMFLSTNFTDTHFLFCCKKGLSLSSDTGDFLAVGEPGNFFEGGVVPGAVKTYSSGGFSIYHLYGKNITMVITAFHILLVCWNSL